MARADALLALYCALASLAARAGFKTKHVAVSKTARSTGCVMARFSCR
jgi:hypothetical protein